MRARLPAAIVVVLVITSGCRGNVNATAGPPITHQNVMASQLIVPFPNPPLFITPPHLGFYVGVGVPYDIAFAYDNFNLYYGKTWYRAPSYKGPWTAVPVDGLPPIIRKQRIEDIHKYRDMEYRTFLRDRNHYRGRVLRPNK